VTVIVAVAAGDPVVLVKVSVAVREAVDVFAWVAMATVPSVGSGVAVSHEALEATVQSALDVTLVVAWVAAAVGTHQVVMGNASVAVCAVPGWMTLMVRVS